MKKVFFLIAFLFAVICYAAPPPDLVVDDIVTEQSAFVVHNNQNVTVNMVEAQEVAYSYLGDCYVYKNGSATTYDSMMLPEVVFTKGVIMYGNYLTENTGYCPNKQNSNYGYPFGADYI